MALKSRKTQTSEFSVELAGAETESLLMAGQNSPVFGRGCGFPDRCSRVFFGCRVVGVPRAARILFIGIHRPPSDL